MCSSSNRDDVTDSHRKLLASACIGTAAADSQLFSENVIFFSFIESDLDSHSYVTLATHPYDTDDSST